MAENKKDDVRVEDVSDPTGRVFEHLFPGNKYDDLKGLPISEKDVRGSSLQSSAYAASMVTGREYVERMI